MSKNKSHKIETQALNLACSYLDQEIGCPKVNGLYNCINECEHNDNLYGDGCWRTYLMNKQDYIIGIDIAKPPFDKADFSCLSMLCLNCNTVIHIELFKGEEPTLDTPKICPECGIIFKQGVIKYK